MTSLMEIAYLWLPVSAYLSLSGLVTHDREQKSFVDVVLHFKLGKRRVALLSNNRILKLYKAPKSKV